MAVFQLNDHLVFPSPHLAEPDGLLAVGGDLSLRRLVLAYENGIFPWFSEDEPVLWWSPSPRLILEPGEFHLGRRLKRKIRQQHFQVTMDTAFLEVIIGCAKTRVLKGEGTWIVDEMISAYHNLHQNGLAHSVECWEKNKLVGGLYGVSLGGIFFGESMFSKITDTSKIALAFLCAQLKEWNFQFIDCQMKTNHLLSLGAREIVRDDFQKRLKQGVLLPVRKNKWAFSENIMRLLLDTKR
jgi:leucyl/phenylalanyl-tRNA---protein transferase